MKGQVTLFIILGIALLIILGLALIIITEIKPKITRPDTTTTNTLSACLELGTRKALFLLGIHGGTADAGPYMNLSYGSRQLPELEIYADSILQQNIPSCLNNPDAELTSSKFRLGKICTGHAAVQVIKENEIRNDESTVNVRVDMAIVQKTAEDIAALHETGWFKEQPLPTDVIDGDSIAVIMTEPDSSIYANTPYNFAFALQKLNTE